MIFTKELDDIFNLIPDGVLITDIHGKHLYVNKSYEQFSKISRENILSKDAHQLKEEGFFNIILNPDVIKNRKKATAIQTLQNGTSVVLDANPIFANDGTVKYVITFVRDNSLMLRLRQQITNQEELLSAFQSLHIPEKNNHAFPTIMESVAMNTFFSKLMLSASTDVTILLTGETGTGKDVFARKIHTASSRANKPFIKIDCSSLPENLIEAELFGYVAGSFSGAHSKGKIGLIEAGSGGTVFLDEIGELPLLMQSRLLRVLQNREVLRIGATSPSPIDVRFIAATNRDLNEELEKGRFRNDLYYRLNVAHFYIPPLRTRKEDILPMVHMFLDHFTSRYSRNIIFTKEVIELLYNYTWPGNVRELENMVHNLVSSCSSGKVSIEDLPVLLQASPVFSKKIEYSPKNLTLKDRVKYAEKIIIQEALEKYGTIKELCAYLNVNRTTLLRKMQAYNLSLEKHNVIDN